MGRDLNAGKTTYSVMYYYPENSFMQISYLATFVQVEEEIKELIEKYGVKRESIAIYMKIPFSFKKGA